MYGYLGARCSYPADTKSAQPSSSGLATWQLRMPYCRKPMSDMDVDRGSRFMANGRCSISSAKLSSCTRRTRIVLQIASGAPSLVQAGRGREGCGKFLMDRPTAKVAPPLLGADSRRHYRLRAAGMMPFHDEKCVLSEQIQIEIKHHYDDADLDR